MSRVRGMHRPIARFRFVGGKLDGGGVRRETLQGQGIEPKQGQLLPIYADDLSATYWYRFRGATLVFAFEEEGVPAHVLEEQRTAVAAAAEELARANTQAQVEAA